MLGFPAIQLQTMVIPKLINDPLFPNFTKDAVENAQTMLFIGWAFGFIIFSPLCDRFGRYWMTYGMCVAVFITAVFGVLAPSSGFVDLYAFALFLAGLSFSFGQFAYMYVQEAMPKDQFAH